MDSRVKHGNDRKWKASRHCASFFYSFDELFRLKGMGAFLLAVIRPPYMTGVHRWKKISEPIDQ